MTVAPPASRPLTTCAAIEFGATPVTTATSPAKRDAAASSATDSMASCAIRSYADASLPDSLALAANQAASSAMVLPRPLKLEASTESSPL